MQPQSPNPNFDFVLKDKPQAQKGFTMPNLPKPILIGLGIVVLIILLTIVSSVASNRKNSATQPMVNVLARSQEITRVTDLLTQSQLNLQDPQTQALAATASATLKSENQQFLNYLAATKVKLKLAQYSFDTDKNTDNTLQSAAQTNSLDAAYVSYLKTALTKYETELQTAYKSAGPKGKVLLSEAFNSADTMLTSPPLKS